MIPFFAQLPTHQYTIFERKASILLKLGAFYNNLLKIHPIYVIWAPSLMKTHQSLRKIAFQKAGSTWIRISWQCEPPKSNLETRIEFAICPTFLCKIPVFRLFLPLVESIFNNLSHQMTLSQHFVNIFNFFQLFLSNYWSIQIILYFAWKIGQNLSNFHPLAPFFGLLIKWPLCWKKSLTERP